MKGYCLAESVALGCSLLQLRHVLRHRSSPFLHPPDRNAKMLVAIKSTIANIAATLVILESNRRLEKLPNT